MTRLLFFPFLFCACIATSTASAQQGPTDTAIFESIAEKYAQLNASAPAVTINGEPVAHMTRFIQPEDEVVEQYKNLRQIALVRHGEPELEKAGKFTREQAKFFMAMYDSVGILKPNEPFFNIGEDEEVAIFASPIERARATAEYLFGTEEDITVSRDFREFETTLGEHSPNLRLPIKVWTAAARVKWILGVDRQGIESFDDARERAHTAATHLAEASKDNSKVVLVAHGFLNRYIRENLEEMGWRVVRDGGSGYLGTTILVKLDEAETKATDTQLALHAEK